MSKTLTREFIREEVVEIMQVVGVSHTRLNNLVNTIKGDLQKPLNLMSLQTLEMANKDLSDAWETLQYFLDPEV